VNPHHFYGWPGGMAVVATQLLVGAALAQTASSPARPTPSAMPEQTTPTEFRSALEGYKPYTEETTVNWKAANDSTAQAGGWRAYAREASASAPAPTAPPGPQPAGVKR
jgi:hypothetical protein